MRLATIPTAWILLGASGLAVPQEVFGSPSSGGLIFADGFESGDTSRWGDQFALLRRVGSTNALHDYWFESNLHAVQGIASLGYHAVKIWPTVDYLHADMRALYEHPEIDVIALRPLQNSEIETGCAGDYFRWENIDYGQIALDLYQEYGHLNKVFVLTGWEADHQLRGLGCGGTPPQAEVDAFVLMLNQRQAGIDAAREQFPFAPLRIYHAVEVNHVAPDFGFSVLNNVIPALAKAPDLMAYSAWGPGGQTANIEERLEIIKTRSGLPANRVFVGEFGRDHAAPGAAADTLAFGTKVFGWGSPLLFMWAYRMEFQPPASQAHSLVTGQWPAIVPTENHTGLSAVRLAYDNFGPDIDVTDGFAVPVPIGSTYSIGTTTVGVPISRALIVRNIGSHTLELHNHLSFVSGSCFWQGGTNPPSSTVAPGQDTTFRVWYSCPTAGTHTGTVAIESNDPNESPWTFTITGTSM